MLRHGWIALAMILPSPLAALTMNWDDPSLVTAGSSSLQQSAGGIGVTARGYVAEIGGADAAVLGPFPTDDGQGTNPAFGIDLSVYNGIGLLAQPIAGIDTAGSDFGAGVFAPGINSWYWQQFDPANPVSKFDFVHFAFDTAVDVDSVIVDDVSNYGRSVWMATGTEAPDFSGGLLAALSGYSIVNSSDDAGDGQFEHALGANGISHLLVGAPPEDGLDALAAGSSQFTILSFGVTEAEDPNGGDGNGGNGGDGPAVIPLPPAIALMLPALLTLFGMRRRA